MILTIVFYFLVSLFLYLMISRPVPTPSKKYSRSTMLSLSSHMQVPPDWTPISQFPKPVPKRIAKPRTKLIPIDDKENIPIFTSTKPSLSSFILTELETSLSELKKTPRNLNPDAKVFVSSNNLSLIVKN